MIKMINQLLRIICNMGNNRDAFDPAVFGDPLAQQISWSPAKGGGANFRTYKLVTVSLERIEFRATIFAKVFSSIFLLVGLGMLVGFLIGFIFAGNTVFPLLLGGVIFAGVGGYLCCDGAKPIVFDKTLGFFWKGKKSPQEVINKDSLKCYTEIKQIHALQLISEYVRGNKSSYYSYEINLVLHDGQRINVIDHGNIKKLREDTTTLANFLGLPVWDAI